MKTLKKLFKHSSSNRLLMIKGAWLNCTLIILGLGLIAFTGTKYSDYASYTVWPMLVIFFLLMLWEKKVADSDIQGDVESKTISPTLQDRAYTATAVALNYRVTFACVVIMAVYMIILTLLAASPGWLFILPAVIVSIKSGLIGWAYLNTNRLSPIHYIH